MLKLGSSGLMVSAWTAVMRLRFASYALGVNGQPIKVDGYFGYDEEKVQKEYQLRTGQFPSGQVSREDLHRLGLLPTLLSIHGTGQADPFGIGYPADIARRVLDLYWWQPVGNWPAKAVPMNGSVDAGERECVRLISNPLIVPGPTAFVDYSQGSVIGGRVRNRMRRKELRGELVAAASFGNPMRLRGHYAGNVDPGGEGIDPRQELAAEPFRIELAAKGDLYTTCPGGQSGEMERAIYHAVFSRFIGEDSLIEQVWELARNPWVEVPAAVKAIVRGGMFAIRGTGPHVRYHIDECPGTGMTYYEYAIKHLRDTAEARLRRIVASVT
ncbi:lysin B [Mycobacterium phage Bartimeaus]|uniref:Lysin B n=54 Tax=Backyardiganvirus TaxID=2946815 RepID=A0A1L5C1A7_9CAUD|nr:lysin B [Mycobacterium phage Arturo]YP_010062740.1 lysin B [Mycobacterium phage Wizard007]AEF57320.1 lysin B [Mycobacterium phage Shaka]AEM05877.1 lysin B [Mycobacterium phage TiroTheta9]AFU20550.1 lysin B [Mycobacterium phage Sabertooth]AGK87126.1 lysin B [Mycobacterium phage Dhanush]AJA43223.1 lysin B [Mycobacterium phage Gadost]ALF01068.1 lysin B [Mycobacterium phage Maverick]ALH46296.1 lysin B [Mycobacterium phage Caelakin]AOQ27566.1 lysin B [Mycobacterium phage Florean]AOT25663.1 